MAEPVPTPDQETQLYSALRKEGKSPDSASRIAAKAVALDPAQVGQEGTVPDPLKS